MSEIKDFSKKPDVSSPLKKRDSYLVVKEDDTTLVTVDRVDKVNIETDGGIKEGVKITCRLADEKDGKLIGDKEVKIKESYSTSSFYLLKDFQSASHWPKEGIYYWVWKSSEGLRWEEA